MWKQSMLYHKKNFHHCIGLFFIHLLSSYTESRDKER